MAISAADLAAVSAADLERAPRAAPSRFGARGVSPVRVVRSGGRDLYVIAGNRPSVGAGGSRIELSADTLKAAAVTRRQVRGLSSLRALAQSEQQSPGLTRTFQARANEAQQLADTPLYVYERDPLDKGGYRVLPGTGSDFARGLAQFAAIAAAVIAPVAAAGVGASAAGGGAAAAEGGKAVLTFGGSEGLTLGNTAAAWDSVLANALPSATTGAAAPSLGLSPILAADAWSPVLSSSLPAIAGGGGGGGLAESLSAFTTGIKDVAGATAAGLSVVNQVRALSAKPGRPTAAQQTGYVPQLYIQPVPGMQPREQLVGSGGLSMTTVLLGLAVLGAIALVARA